MNWRYTGNISLTEGKVNLANDKDQGLTNQAGADPVIPGRLRGNRYEYKACVVLGREKRELFLSTKSRKGDDLLSLPGTSRKKYSQSTTKPEPRLLSELQASQHCGKGVPGWALEGYLQVVGGAPNEANLLLRKSLWPFFFERNMMFAKELSQAFGLFFAR